MEESAKSKKSGIMVVRLSVFKSGAADGLVEEQGRHFGRYLSSSCFGLHQLPL